MKRSAWGFYPMFVLAVAAILVLSIVIGATFLGILFSHGFIRPTQGNPFSVIVLIALPSILIGLLIAVTFGRKAVKPINELSRGLKEVASGDFSIRLNECERGQFGEVNHDFNMMAQELASTEMLREDFIVNVSHEFKSPLSSIQGYATLLQDATLTEEERAEYLEAIFSATRSLSNMSSNILLLSNLETQAGALPKERFSLDEQIRHVIVMLEPIISEKGIGLDIDLESVDIEANQELLENVWVNLVGNAIKFTEEGGVIAVTLSRQSDGVLASVADNGCGMSESDKVRIFDKFYQADGSHRTEGNGLGLALANTIVRRHGGTIRVESEVGKGSKFTVALPGGTTNDEPL